MLLLWKWRGVKEERRRLGSVPYEDSRLAQKLCDICCNVSTLYVSFWVAHGYRFARVLM